MELLNAPAAGRALALRREARSCEAAVPGAGLLIRRGLDFQLSAPLPAMRACVVVPARNEEMALPVLLAGLAEQCDRDGIPLDPACFEVILLLNNCTDRTQAVAEAFRRSHPRLQLHLAQVSFPPEEAHVGRARQALFDLAFERFQALCRPDGLILTTDADSRPAPDWIAQNEAEIALGVDAVGGRICLDPVEKMALPPGVRRFHLLDIAYRRGLEELRSLYAPEEHDPFPRHHQHFGGSLAVTAQAYAAAGGMPLRPFNEDVGLYRAILESGGLVRHSYRVQMQTSPRIIGRARGGLADAIHWWNDQAQTTRRVMVESASAAEIRLARLGCWLAENPRRVAPVALATTPEQPPAEQTAEIQQTIRALREINTVLRPLSHPQRLRQARSRLAGK